MVEIGRRVVVYGHSCSGKTTLAKRIAEKVDVSHVELDAIFWKPDWAETPVDEFRTTVSALLKEHADGWVFDGNYHSRIRDLVLPEADTAVLLRLPFRIVFWQALVRTISRAWTKEPLWVNNCESWRQSFFSTNSLLLFIIMKWRRHIRETRQMLGEISHNARVVELHSRKEIAAFIVSLSGADN